MFERFSDTARAAMVHAQEEARRLGHDRIATGHLLLGVLVEEEGLGGRVLRRLGLDRDAVAGAIRALESEDAEAPRDDDTDLGVGGRRDAEPGGPGISDQPRRRGRGFPFYRRDPAIPFTAAAKEALEQSVRQALALEHEDVGTEHLVLGLLADDATPTARMLQRLGIAPDLIRARLRSENGEAD